MRRSRAAAIGGLVAVVLLSALPAGGQTTSPDPMDVSLVEIEGVVGANQDDASLRAAIEVRSGPVRRHDLRLVTTVFTRVTDAMALRGVLGGAQAPVFGATSTELPDLEPGTSRVLRISTDTGELALRGPGLAGVYPVRLQIFEGPDPVGSVMTSLIVLPENRPAPLLASSIMRLSSVAAPLRGDRPGPSLEGLLQPNSSLAVFADEVDAVVADGSAAGVSLAVDGRLLDDLQRLSDGYLREDRSAVDSGSRLARRAHAAVDSVQRLSRRGDTEVLAYPYGPADLVALIRHGLTEEALRQVRAGAGAVTAVTGQPLSTDILIPPDGLNAQTMAALGPVAADAVLLEERYLEFANADGLEPVRRLRTPDGGEVRILVPDAGLSQLLYDPAGAGTAVVVQHMLAETALRWLSSATSPGRSTALLLDFDALALNAATTGGLSSSSSGTTSSGTTSSAPPSIPAGTIAAATQAITQASWLRPVALSTLRTRVEPSDRFVELAYPARSAAAELGPDYLAQLQQARDALTPLSQMLPADDRDPTTYAAPLDAMASLAYRDPAIASEGLQRAAQLLDRLQEATDAVQILPSAPVTLTSTTGEVPVTVTNTSDVTMDVRATVSASRFDFPGGNTQTITLPPQTTQRLIFQAQALNPGGFAPLLVTLTDPTGSLELTRQQLSVRSTAIPIVGVVATVGSVLVLLFWGIKQGRRRPGRHERRPHSASAA